MQSVRQVFFVAPGGGRRSCGGLARPSQRHHILETGNPGALRRICVSCLSNASSSEAMFLLKPLKELRAKRKGTHLCLSACVRVRALLNSCVSKRLLSSLRFSPTERTSASLFPRRISGAVCLLCPLFGCSSVFVCAVLPVISPRFLAGQLEQTHNLQLN